MDDQNFGGTDKDNIARLKKGIDTLFKKDIVVKPDYITAPQVEALVKGLWNVFNAEGFNAQEKQKVKIKYVSPTWRASCIRCVTMVVNSEFVPDPQNLLKEQCGHDTNYFTPPS